LDENRRTVFYAVLAGFHTFYIFVILNGIANSYIILCYSLEEKNSRKERPIQ